MTTPILSTKRLTLRPVVEADAPAIQARFADYEVIRHLRRGVPWPYPADGALSFIREQVLPVQGRSKWFWALHLDGVDGAIGVIDLWREARPDNRGFWLGRDFWGRGCMTEAADRVTDYAFETLGFEELIFKNARGNRRSRNVKLRAGVRLIDIRPAQFVDPAYTEAEIWRLTKSDWAARRSERND